MPKIAQSLFFAF